MHTVVHVCSQTNVHACACMGGMRARWARLWVGLAKGQEQECGRACALMSDMRVRWMGVCIGQSQCAYLSVHACMHAWVGCCHLFYSLTFLPTSSPSFPASSPIISTMTNASLPACSPPHLPLHPFHPLGCLPPLPPHPTPCPSICPSQFPYTLPLLPAHPPGHDLTHYHTCLAPLQCVTSKCASRTGHVGGCSDRKACVHACIWSFHACVGAGVCTDVHIAMYV